MEDAKTIYCPSCNRIACHYNGRQTINPMGKCKKCRKLVVYDIETGETILKTMPERTQSSGLTFY